MADVVPPLVVVAFVAVTVSIAPNILDDAIEFKANVIKILKETSDNDALARARQIRKTLPLFVPSVLAALGFIWFAVLRQLGDALRDLADRAPVVRVGNADPIAIVAFPLLLTVLFFVVLKSVPIWPKGSRILGQAIHWMAILAVAALVLGIPAGRFLQQRYLPEAGYSACRVLKGSPTVFFTDWVRNPAWCVSGKDRN